jgi:hypothetical protein
MPFPPPQGGGGERDLPRLSFGLEPANRLRLIENTKGVVDSKAGKHRSSQESTVR